MLRDLYAEAEISQRIDILKLSLAYQFGKPKESVEIPALDGLVDALQEGWNRATKQGE